MVIATDESILKLYTDKRGSIWYANGIAPAADSGHQIDAFLSSALLNGFGKVVRILGVPQNAELIAALHLRRYKNEIASLEVAGPNILHAQAELDDPALVLQRMRAVDISAAAGGWHKLALADYPTYAMLARMLRTNFVFDDTVKNYLQLHPVRRAALFIPTIDEIELTKLLVTTVDPRWFVDRRAPDRAGKLELFLGLTPRNQKRVSDPKQLLSRRRELRCANVLATWKTKPIEEVDLQDPANFLYRICAARKNPVLGQLRASQAFVRYLRYNWLAALDSRRGVHDGIFVPSMFFKTPAESAAYTEYMQKKRQAE